MFAFYIATNFLWKIYQKIRWKVIKIISVQPDAFDKFSPLYFVIQIIYHRASNSWYRLCISCVLPFHGVILTFIIWCIVIIFHLIAIFANYFNPSSNYQVEISKDPVSIKHSRRFLTRNKITSPGARIIPRNSYYKPHLANVHVIIYTRLTYSRKVSLWS